MATMDEALQTDLGLKEYSSQFSTKIAASATQFGFTPGNLSAYAAAVLDYSTKLGLATDPATRGEATIYQKQVARGVLATLTRQFARQINGLLSVTDEQRQELGLNIRPTERPLIEAPKHAPILLVEQVIGHSFKLRLKDATGERRGRPTGCAGATLWSFIGEDPPADTDRWFCHGDITKTRVTLTMPIWVPKGTKMFLTAAWYAPRGLAGPACSAVETGIGYEGEMPLSPPIPVPEAESA